MNDSVRIILEVRKNEKTTVFCKFFILDTLSLHPQLGVPIMHHHQLNIIATYLSDMKEKDNMSTLVHQTYLNNCLSSIKTIHSNKARKLTRLVLNYRMIGLLGSNQNIKNINNIMINIFLENYNLYRLVLIAFLLSGLMLSRMMTIRQRKRVQLAMVLLI